MTEMNGRGGSGAETRAAMLACHRVSHVVVDVATDAKPRAPEPWGPDMS